ATSTCGRCRATEWRTTRKPREIQNSFSSHCMRMPSLLLGSHSHSLLLVRRRTLVSIMWLANGRPSKSKAQRRKFRAASCRGKDSNQTFERWNRLHERVARKRPAGKQTARKRTKRKSYEGCASARRAELD